MIRAKKETILHLESIIDAIGLMNTLEAIADICYDKAEHLRSNWQDEKSAKCWESDGDELHCTIGRLSL